MAGGTIRAQVAVVGGGPAGLMAASTAARYGARVVLIDEKSAPGGQLFKQIHKFFGSQRHWAGVRGMEIGRYLLEEADRTGVQVWLGTSVWGIFPSCRGVGGRIATAARTEQRIVEAERVVLGTGAGENPLAFEGWTLPGVMGAGAAQTMTNIHRVRPGTRALVVGTGNVGLIVAYQLLQAGIDVVALVEAKPRIGGYGVHAAKLKRMGVPVLTGYTIWEVKGKEGVEQAVIAPVGEGGAPIPGTELVLRVDLICMAVGLSPAAELCWVADCRMAFSGALGGYVPVHDRNMETSVPGLYVAGDVAGVEEASTAMEEGRLAGVAAAESLGLIGREQAEEEKGAIWRSLDALRSGSFGEMRFEAKNALIKMSTMGRRVKRSNVQGPTSNV